MFRARYAVQFRPINARMQVLLECIFKIAYAIILKCCGELDQMVECLLSMQEVLGSIPRFSNVFFLVISFFLFSCRCFFFLFYVYSALFWLYSVPALKVYSLFCLPTCTGCHVTHTERAISEDHGIGVWYGP